MEHFTEFLAIWGAGLSTFLAFLKAIEFYRDRAIIKVSVRGGYSVYPAKIPRNPYGNEALVIITACNVGRRPVTLKKAALLKPRGSNPKYALVNDSMTTIELSEGKSHDYHVSEEEIKQIGLNPENCVVCVIDATGRYYWSHNVLHRFIKLRRIH